MKVRNLKIAQQILIYEYNCLMKIMKAITFYFRKITFYFQKNFYFHKTISKLTTNSNIVWSVLLRQRMSEAWSSG